MDGSDLPVRARAEDIALSKPELVAENRKRREKQDKQRHALRNIYGYGLLSAVILQIVAVNVFYILDGTGTVKPSDDVFKVFSVSVFSEIVALALVVTRSLFPGEESWISKVFGRQKRESADD